MVTEFLWPGLIDMDSDEMWYAELEITQLLHERFPSSAISRTGDQNWPPRSYDLTPCEFFLWGLMKTSVYANQPTTIPGLKEEIRRVVGDTIAILKLCFIEQLNLALILKRQF